MSFLNLSPFGPRDYIEGRPIYVLRNKKPVRIKRPTKEWDACVPTQIGSKHFKNGVVSTVFLGIDHRTDTTEGEPLVFETWIQRTGTYIRYGSWSEAEEGHKKAVETETELENSK